MKQAEEKEVRPVKGNIEELHSNTRNIARKYDQTCRLITKYQRGHFH